MSNIILGKIVTNIDNVRTSHIKSFACRPEKGDMVKLLQNDKPKNFEVCRITHTWENTHHGAVPIIVVEVNKPTNIL